MPSVAGCWPDARSVSSASKVCVAAWSPWCRQVHEADGQQPSWARLHRRRSSDERWGAPDAGVHYSTSTCCHNMHIPVRDKYYSCEHTIVTMKEKCHSTIWTYCNLTKKGISYCYHNNNNRFTALCPGLLGWAATRRNTHPPSWSSFNHLLWPIASSLFKLRAWQSFCTTSLHVLFGLPLGLEPSTSYSIHFFTQSVSSFCSTSIPSLSLNSLFGLCLLP